MRRTGAILAIALACAGCKDDAKRRDDPRPRDDLYELRGEVAQMRAIDRELAGVHFVWIAEAAPMRGELRAAIVWPALQDNRIIDNDIVAFVFRRDGASWRLIDDDDRAVIGPGISDADLIAALGGDFTLIKPDGLPVPMLGPALLAAAHRFHDALRASHPEDAVAAAEEFLRGFGPKLVVEDNDAVDMLVDNVLDKVTRAELRDVPAGDDHPSVTFAITACESADPASCRDDRMPATLARLGAGWIIDTVGER